MLGSVKGRRLPFAAVLSLVLAVTLLPAAGAAEPPWVALGQTTPGNVFAAGTVPTFDVRSPAGEVAWSVRDYWGHEVATGRARDGTLPVPVTATGYYELRVGAARTSFVVLPEVDRTAPADVRFGMQTHFGQSGVGWNPNLIPLLEDIGVGTVRDAQQWQAIETSRGVYDFTVENGRFENYMAGLEQHGIPPLTNFGGWNPNYDNGATPYTTDGRQGMARFAQEVLGHYGNQIHQVGIYNEPNLPKFGDHGDGPCDATPSCHFQLAREMYPAIKAVRPDVTVVAPELLAGTANINTWLAWLRDYSGRGGLRYLDVVSLHTYRRCCTPEGLADDLARVRDLLDNYAAGNKPIWITEMGWRTDEVSEQTQAEYLPRAYTVAFASGVPRFYWYNFKDHNSGPFGLLRSDNSPKPSYQAYAAMTGQLAGRAYQGRDDTPDGIHSDRFGTGRDTVRVMWSTEGTAEVNLTMNEPARVTDLMGGQRTLTPSPRKLGDGKTPSPRRLGDGAVLDGSLASSLTAEPGGVRLTLTSDPVYVRGPVSSVTLDR